MNNPCEKMRDKIADYVLGLLNQEMSRRADTVIFMQSGIPVTIKGESYGKIK